MPAFPRPPGDGPALLAYSARAIIFSTKTRRRYLLPLLHGIIAMGYYLWAQRYMGRAGIVISLTVVGFMTISNIVTDLQHHSALVETGDRRGSSGALNQPASYWDESGQRQPIAQDWGLKYNVPILTQALAAGERVHLSHGVDDYVTYPRLLLSEKRRVNQACGTHS